MAGNNKPSEKWSLRSGGTAWVYPANGAAQVVDPVIVVAEPGQGPTDLDAFSSRVDGPDYPLRTKLGQRGKDVILVGYGDQSDWDTAEQVIVEAAMRTQAMRSGGRPMAVVGAGRAALLTRYALAHLEKMRMNHEVAAFFSLDSTTPTADEQRALNAVGAMPMLPRSQKITSAGTHDLEGLGPRDDPDSSQFDDALYASGPASETSLVNEEEGNWLLERI
ncbi:hypothetical protein ACFXG4_38595 [Nocardia sp. NPDC059246]|uniref:hypothetical protein n=1 Tax=unclassified Nocardia TaxID=2637762 RepID=UPI0036C41665